MTWWQIAEVFLISVAVGFVTVYAVMGVLRRK